jgi:hypothetical protein
VPPSQDAQPERTSRGLRAARVNRRPPRFAAMVMALGIIFALAYVFVVRAPPPVPTPQIQSIRGTFTWRVDGQGGNQGSVDTDGAFSAVAGGNAGGDAKAPSGQSGLSVWSAQSAYDATTRSERTAAFIGPNPSYLRTIDAWPPVWRVATRSPLDYQGLAAIVRTAVEDHDSSVGVKPLKDGERKVWRAAMKLDGKDVEVVVDQLTGIVLWYTDGHATFTAAVGWGSPPPADATYSVSVPAGLKVMTKRDNAYAYVSSLAEAGRAAGYAPLASDLAPDGFALKAVATADTMGAPGHWLVRDGNSPPIDALAGQRQVAQLYTRGLSWFSVQQLGPDAAAKSAAGLRDMLGSMAPDKLSFETTTLQYGALTGATAYTWYEATGPTLFVSAARHMVYITGALTRQELISFAEGLKPLGQRPGSQSSNGSNSSLPTPQSGQTQSSGRSANAVPGSTPLSGSPASGS